MGPTFIVSASGNVPCTLGRSLTRSYKSSLGMEETFVLSLKMFNLFVFPFIVPNSNHALIYFAKPSFLITLDTDAMRRYHSQKYLK